VTTAHDHWAHWVLHRRDAGDARVRQAGAPQLADYRDGVLDRAVVADGDVLLDVGTGDGLIGFAALDRVGPRGQVIFSDISADLLDECRRRATAEDLLERCRFVRAGADDLGGIADGSVDVVTTRSVLIYVARKQEAFAEFFRVLRPGGRLSIFEPINRFTVAEASGELFGLDITPVADLAAKVRAAVFTVSTELDPMLRRCSGIGNANASRTTCARHSPPVRRPAGRSPRPTCGRCDPDAIPGRAGDACGAGYSQRSPSCRCRNSAAASAASVTYGSTS
jgi:ubiquinone/menaquinone biosynthesis C-methylase UbiE